jgi:membrane protease YdiL (CAAX protease family)
MVRCALPATAQLLGAIRSATADGLEFVDGSLVPGLIDTGIRCIGLGIACIAVALWLIASRRDPLRSAPPRPNTLHPEAILLVVLTYFLAGWLIASGIGAAEPGGKVANTNVNMAADSNTKRRVPGANGETNAMEGESSDVRAADAPGDNREPSVGMSLADSCAKVFALIVAFFLLRQSFEGGVWSFLFGSGQWARQLVEALLLTVVALAFCDITVHATMWAVHFLRPEYVFEHHSTIQLLNKPGQSLAAIITLRIGAAVVSPLAEEVFFRGMLQTVLLSFLRSRWLVIVVTSFLFALPHEPLYALPALFVLAIFLGYAYERSGCLWPPILMHVLFNTKTLVWDAYS